MATEPDLRSRLSARLLRLDSCALSDALDRLGLQGCVTGLALCLRLQRGDGVLG
jgi:hypothetical protein